MHESPVVLHVDGDPRAREATAAALTDALPAVDVRWADGVAEGRPRPADDVEEAWETVETGSATPRVETSATVRADASRLRRLLDNCFRNSVEHGGSDVTVTVGDLDDGFYVEDDGEGVPANQAEQVFDLGYTTASTGTGFGPGIVSEIVDAHGGTVDLVDGAAGGARAEFGGVQRVASA